MKIFYVTQFYYPERAAGAFRAIDNSVIWSENGADVTIFTTYPNFPTGQIFKGYENKILSKEEYKKIKIYRNKIIVNENTSKLRRAISSLSFMMYSIQNIIFKAKKIGTDYDVVLGTSGTILAPIIAYIFSKKNKIPFVFELRDITYNQILAVYGGKKGLLYYLVKFIELYLCKKARKIVVVTDGFKKQLIKENIDSEKIEVIKNGVLIREQKNDHKSDYNEKIVFSYIGNLGASQNLSSIIDLFQQLKIDNFKKELIFIGDGGKKEDLRRYIEENEICDVYIIDGMEPEKLEKYYNESNFCIVSLNNNVFFKDTIPSKIFTLMLKKKVVLFLGPNGEASKIIKNAKCGLAYTDDIRSISKDLQLKINELIRRNELQDFYANCGDNGFDFVRKNYNREQLAKNYLEVLESIKNKE